MRVIAAGRADPSGEVFSVVDGVVGRLGADAAPALAAAVGDEGADPVTRAVACSYLGELEADAVGPPALAALAAALGGAGAEAVGTESERRACRTLIANARMVPFPARGRSSRPCDHTQASHGIDGL